MWRRPALWGLLAWLCAGPASAEGISLSPVTVVLRPGEQAATVWLTNRSGEVFEGVAEVYGWRQEAGDERLDPTPQMAVSPQRLVVPPGGRQRLRIVVPEDYLAREEGAGELSFRLIVEQKAGEAGEAIQYSLPVFVMPPGQEPPRLIASVERAGDHVRLRIHNEGEFHVKLVDLACQPPGKPKQMLVPDLAGYVLPGSYKAWELPGTASELRDDCIRVLANGVPVNVVLTDP